MANLPNKQNKPCLNPILLSKDRGILSFLWRHRIATFSALKTIFYPESSHQQAYYQLRRLRRGQYVKVDKLNGTKNTTWRLERRGFQYLVENGVLPELRTKGFRPQSSTHDLYVAAALLGDWLIRRPRSVTIVTEQELAAINLSCLPTEIRREREHQPDGIWIFDRDNRRSAIALEMELFAKSEERYEQTCAFYASQLFFEHVVWIVADKALAQKILDASQRHGIPRSGVHLFVLLEDFKRLGWSSKFQNKSLEAITLGSFLASLAGPLAQSSNHHRLTIASPSNHPNVPQEPPTPFLDFRVSLENLRGLRQARAPKNS